MTASRADSYKPMALNQLERSDQTILANDGAKCHSPWDAVGPGVLRLFRDRLFEESCLLNRATDPQP